MALSDFFNTYLNPIKIIESKREYKEQMSRVKTLPEDYQYVFEKMGQYLWMHITGDGMDMLKIQYDLISVFEDGAKNGKHVLEITGENVAGYCNEILKKAGISTDTLADKLNKDIAKKIKK